MFQSGMWTLRIIIATALLAVMADAASAGPLRDRFAARRGGYYGGGYSNGGYYGYGYGGRYSGGYGYGGYGYGGYSGMSYGYSGYYPGIGSSGYQSGYYTPVNDMTATIELRVPLNALVFFDDEPTRQRGEMRTFSSPPLTGDKSYHYTVRVKWEDGGKPVEKTQVVEVRAGRRTVADFLRPEKDEK
jgi:uncharacterized protein (TIGR03000 family)